ncbi:hypothetical protein QA609_23885 [Natronococcus sp. A-GB7]|nr:hypothetical protein [Natronococcus sp. A-GB7]MDG5821819.1 hypothetical protein [Natronococcus sp. A-GB7]
MTKSCFINLQTYLFAAGPHSYGWDHETALLKHLKNRPAIRQQLGFKTLPDQSTLWRTWHCRFSSDLQETIQKSARLLLTNANREAATFPETRFMIPRAMKRPVSPITKYSLMQTRLLNR